MKNKISHIIYRFFFHVFQVRDPLILIKWIIHDLTLNYELHTKRARIDWTRVPNWSTLNLILSKTHVDWNWKTGSQIVQIFRGLPPQLVVLVGTDQRVWRVGLSSLKSIHPSWLFLLNNFLRYERKVIFSKSSLRSFFRLSIHFERKKFFVINKYISKSTFPPHQKNVLKTFLVCLFCVTFFPLLFSLCLLVRPILLEIMVRFVVLIKMCEEHLFFSL